MTITQEHDCITLADGNFSISILPLGATIERIMMPNRLGQADNVVMTFADRANYCHNPGYLGATIGRFAGRISKAQVKLNQTDYPLNVNIPPHQLHGGVKGLHSKQWQIEKTETGADYISLTLSTHSPAFEEGFPADLNVRITYTLYLHYRLEIRYEAHSDADTLFNPTNHSYFNLSGSLSQPITTHHLALSSNTMLGIKADGTLSGEVIPIKMSQPRPLADILATIEAEQLSNGGLDHPFLFDNPEQGQIDLYHQASGRGLHITTDRRAVVIYTKNFLLNTMLDIGRLDQQHDAICLEVQQPPIGDTGQYTQESVLKAGNPFTSVSTYQFYIK